MATGDPIPRVPDRDWREGVHERVVRAQLGNALEAVRWLIVEGKLGRVAHLHVLAARARLELVSSGALEPL